MAAEGEASWAEFAEAIFAASAEIGGPAARVKHITTANFPTAARRPANSRLDSDKLARAHGARLPDWRSSMKQVVKRLLEAGNEGALTR
jgi:dTDP-4-dehydrorhamnose reductase